jgi:hypothetical protein
MADRETDGPPRAGADPLTRAARGEAATRLRRARLRVANERAGLKITRLRTGRLFRWLLLAACLGLVLYGLMALGLWKLAT